MLYSSVQGMPAKLVRRLFFQKLYLSLWIQPPYFATGLPAEANLLAAQAVSAGVPFASVVVEDKAQNSIENALNCLPILQRKNVHDICLVTSDYHMARCRLLFELVLQGTNIKLSWAEVRATWYDHHHLMIYCCYCKFLVPSSLSYVMHAHASSPH